MSSGEDSPLSHSLSLLLRQSDSVKAYLSKLESSEAEEELAADAWWPGEGTPELPPSTWSPVSQAFG
jgi:hypothetical protein